MARAGSQRSHLRQANHPRGRHGKESEESKEDCQGDQESRQEDQEDEEVSARFSANQSRRGIATTIAGELDASQDVSCRKRGDDQTGPMCTRLKKPTTDAHGSGFLCPDVGRVTVAAVSGDSSACDLALFAHPFVEGVASGRLQRSFIDDRQRQKRSPPKSVF